MILLARKKVIGSLHMQRKRFNYVPGSLHCTHYFVVELPEFACSLYNRIASFCALTTLSVTNQLRQYK